MNYIVFDLEWNQPADGKKNSERKLLFEIIEIGAVKLNEKREIIDSFHELVCPQVYHQINWHTQKMLNLKIGELKKGDKFKTVMNRFLKWCGSEEYIFCSWGSQDLTELQRNMKYYHMKPLSEQPIPFYNVQKLFGIQIGEEDSAKNLEAAVEIAGIEKDVPFHRAYSDAYYTARIFGQMKEELIKNQYSYDLYHIPRSKKEEVRICNNMENIYISRGMSEKTDITKSRQMMAINCMKCGQKPVRAKIRWFSSNNKIYYCAGFCPEHGYIKGKLKIKKSEQGEYYAEKVLTYIDKDEVDALKEKKQALKKNQKNQKEKTSM